MAESIPFENFQPPPASVLLRRLKWGYRYFRPKLFGAEHVNPERPALFVGNHCIYGVIDSPFFMCELYRQTGVYPRSLGDHFHWNVPGWSSLLTEYGAVPGTRENCSRLMEDGQFILVFPGGAREVAKRRGEENRLEWKQRTGFARMAIAHGYDILPFASVGCDDSFSILYDAEDFRDSWLGSRLLAQPRLSELLRGGDLFMPVARGLGPTALPRPGPFWFQIGAPIATAQLQGREDDEAVLWSLRGQVADSIERMIEDLRQRQQASRDQWPLWQRLLSR